MSTPVLLSAAIADTLGQHPAITPMAFVRAVTHAYAQRGMDAGAALAVAQIPPSTLANGQGRITALQLECLCNHAMQELNDEALGWFSRRLPWGSYGMLARASISSGTLGLAIARWCRHHGLLTDDIALTLHNDGRLASIILTEQRNLGVMREFCIISVLCNLHGLASWYVDMRLPLLRATFPFPAPDHAKAYAVLFNAPVVFDAPTASLELAGSWLKMPLARDEAALHTMLQRALPLQIRPYKPAQPLLERVRQALATHPQCAHTAQTLAAMLRTTARSLHRQLSQQGSGLQQIKDDVRRERACTLLLRTDLPIKRIAQSCGFASEKSFSRAFRGWTGTAPTLYRQQHRHPS